MCQTYQILLARRLYLHRSSISPSLLGREHRQQQVPMSPSLRQGTQSPAQRERLRSRVLPTSPLPAARLQAQAELQRWRQRLMLPLQGMLLPRRLARSQNPAQRMLQRQEVPSQAVPALLPRRAAQASRRLAVPLLRLREPRRRLALRTSPPRAARLLPLLAASPSARVAMSPSMSREVRCLLPWARSAIAAGRKFCGSRECAYLHGWKRWDCGQCQRYRCRFKFVVCRWECHRFHVHGRRAVRRVDCR